MRKLIGPATLAILAVVAVLAWREHSRAQAARWRLAQIAGQRAKLAAEIAALEAGLSQSHQREAILQRETVPAVAQTTPPAATQSPPPALDKAAVLEANPGLRPLFRKSVQAELALRYRPFYDAAHLSTEQKEKFEQLMLEVEEIKTDFQATAPKYGFNVLDPAVRDLAGRASAELKAAQIEILGEEGYRQLEEFRRVEPLEVLVNDFAKLSVQASSPLSLEQSEQLLYAMAAASPRYRAGERAELDSVDWEKTFTDAQAFLSAEQTRVFRSSVQLQEVFGLVRQFYREQSGNPKK